MHCSAPKGQYGNQRNFFHVVWVCVVTPCYDVYFPLLLVLLITKLCEQMACFGRLYLCNGRPSSFSSNMLMLKELFWVSDVLLT